MCCGRALHWKLKKSGYNTQFAFAFCGKCISFYIHKALEENFRWWYREQNGGW